jgi:two-component system sensor histidine kinase KdpD
MYLTPKFNFTIGTFSQVLTFFIFIFVVLLISQLTARSRLSLIALKDKEARLSMLYNFSKKLSKYNMNKDFIKVIVDTLSLNFKYKFVFIDVTNDAFFLRTYPDKYDFNEKEIIAARWVWQHKSICGATTNTFSGLQWYFEPFLVDDRIFGIISIYMGNKEDEINFSSDYLMIKQMLIQASQLLLKQFLENEEHKFKSLEWKQKLQKSMLSSVSHDLKTPLASIMGSVSSVISYRDKFSEKDQKEILEIAYKESQRLDKYVDNIMQMLKLESQGAFLNKQLIDIERFIKEVQEICKARFPQEKILFLEIRNPFIFSGDSILLQQVLLNIIANSVKFSISNQSSIVISIEKGMSNFHICIKDQGIGIKEEDLEKIFTIFYRIHKEDTYSKGNGLGLAICKGIIEAHNGNIIASSKGENKGTNIKITIPLIL